MPSRRLAHAFVLTCVGVFALTIGCTVVVPTPVATPRPAPAISDKPGCELLPTCGPGCFDFDEPHNRACLQQWPRSRGDSPVLRETIVEHTQLSCIADTDCAVATAGDCPCPACPTVLAVGTRIARQRQCTKRVPCTPCASAPTHARCEAGVCVGVITTIEVTF